MVPSSGRVTQGGHKALCPSRCRHWLQEGPGPNPSHGDALWSVRHKSHERRGPPPLFLLPSLTRPPVATRWYCLQKGADREARATLRGSHVLTPARESPSPSRPRQTFLDTPENGFLCAEQSELRLLYQQRSLHLYLCPRSPD